MEEKEEMKSLLIAELKRKYEYIESTECAMTPNEMMNLIAVMQHEPMRKEDAFIYLGYPEDVFDRYVERGLLPKGKKRADEIDTIWYRDELNDAVIRMHNRYETD